jgi:hypothetical protein
MDDPAVVRELASHVMAYVRAEKGRQYLYAEYQKALKVNDTRKLITESKPPIQEFLKVTNQSVPAIQINLSETETENCVWIVPTLTKSHKSTKSGLVERLTQALVNPEMAEGVAQTLSPRAVNVAVFVLASIVDQILHTNMSDVDEREIAQQIANTLDTPVKAKTPTPGIKLVAKPPDNLDLTRVYYLKPT